MMSVGRKMISYRVVSTEGRKLLEILLQMNDSIFSDEIKELEKLLRRAENNLRENLGVPVAIRLVEAHK
jgi:phenylacetate-CoA ligase